MAKVDYGIDAPGVVRTLALCGAALLIIRAFTATIRVLKPGGAAVISDFKNTGSYARAFKEAGLTVSRKFYLVDTFFPVSIVYAKKPV